MNEVLMKAISTFRGGHICLKTTASFGEKLEAVVGWGDVDAAALELALHLGLELVILVHGCWF